MNKRAILAGVAIILVFFLAKDLMTSESGGQSATAVNAADEKIVALSTFTVIGDMVSEIGGDKVESLSLTKTGVDIHAYEPTPGDLVRASRGDILFENGMNLELWAAKLRANIPDMPSVIVSEGVNVLEIVEGSYEGKPNPHAWMSPQQGLIYIENIRKGLVDLAPEHEEYFNTNAKAYSDELREVDKTLNEALSKLPANNRYLVTCEGAFTYLTNDYDLKELYLWAINDESGGSPQQVAKVIDVVKENQIPAVFCESTVAPKIQMEVVNATDARFGGTLFVDSLSEKDGPAPTYLSLLQGTVETVVSGLSGK
jgi:manganese transport system substrate-binding protein